MTRLSNLLAWRGVEGSVKFFAELHPKIWGLGVTLSFDDDILIVVLGPTSFGLDWS